MKRLAEALFLCGVAAITYGTFLIHPACGFVFSGVVVIGFSALLNWKPPK